MKNVMNLVWKLRIWKDTRGQDLIEYALMAGFVALAAGAIMPGVSASISTIFSKVVSLLRSASGQGRELNPIPGRSGRGNLKAPRKTSELVASDDNSSESHKE